MDRGFLGLRPPGSHELHRQGEGKRFCLPQRQPLVETANALILTFTAPAVNRAGLYFRHSFDQWT